MVIKSVWFSMVVMGLLGSGMAQGATPYKRTLTVKKNEYIQDGVFTGGQAGSGVTLLGVRRVHSPKAKLERIILDLGNKEGKVAKGEQLGYFQASVDSQRNRIVLDLAQLRLSQVTETKLKEMFRKSPYVRSVELTMDPEDSAGSLVLNLRQPMRLEVFRLVPPGKAARVVMDITPASKMQVKTR